MVHIVFSLFVGLAFGQKAAVTEIPVDSNSGTTTISIKKGDATTDKETTEILDGTAEITGDPNPMQRAAREAWKKSCEEWKKEVKELNKDNQVLVLNCNSPKCKVEAGGTTCKSDATYKLKVKMKK